MSITDTDPSESPEDRINRLEAIYAAVQRTFNADQINKMVNPDTKKHWSNETLQKSIQLYLQTGASPYEFLRSQGHPVPHERTLRRHMAEIDFEPGLLHSFFRFLRLKSEKIEPNERST